MEDVNEYILTVVVFLLSLKRFNSFIFFIIFIIWTENNAVKGLMMTDAALHINSCLVQFKTITVQVPLTGSGHKCTFNNHCGWSTCPTSPCLRVCGDTGVIPHVRKLDIFNGECSRVWVYRRFSSSHITAVLQPVVHRRTNIADLTGKSEWQIFDYFGRQRFYAESWVCTC